MSFPCWFRCRISYRGRTRCFLVHEDTATLREAICQQFGLPLDAQLCVSRGLDAEEAGSAGQDGPDKQARGGARARGDAEDVLVVPLHAACLEADVHYTLCTTLPRQTRHKQTPRNPSSSSSSSSSSGGDDGLGGSAARGTAATTSSSGRMRKHQRRRRRHSKNRPQSGKAGSRDESAGASAAQSPWMDTPALPDLLWSRNDDALQLSATAAASNNEEDADGDGDAQGAIKEELESMAQGSVLLGASGASGASAASAASAAPTIALDDLPDNHVVALYDYVAQSSTELGFSRGDVINVIGQYNEGWWKGEIERPGDLVPEEGYFPVNYVGGLERIKVLSEEHEDPFQDDAYFDSYATLSIHLQMLSDRPRTLGYKQAVENLREHIEGKIVLDVGCGSSILSCFCAMAGAKHVYAVDASNIIHMAAAKVVKENGLEDQITLLKGKIEEVQLPVDKVDVIVSEWMGTFMVCESMISSVLAARLKYLDPDGGIMMPSRCTLFLAPINLEEHHQKHVGFWDDVYGVKMTSLKDEARATFFNRPVYDQVVKAESLIADEVPIWDLDMGSAVEEDLEEHDASFDFVVSRTGDMHGYVAWFDSLFDAPDCPEDRRVTLYTSPRHEPTHWKQVMFLLQEPHAVTKGQRITGTLRTIRNKSWRRHFEVCIAYKLEGDEQEYTQNHQLWR